MAQSGLPDCDRCNRGDKDTYRIIVRADVMGQRYLAHAHRDDSLQVIMLRLCTEYPDVWAIRTVYYFYVDLGGNYYAVENSFWLRDKDQVLVTTTKTVEELPDISMNAIHASLRDHVQLQPHQEEGVQKMIWMERAYRGGILADDMGLGKTLQMLALIMRQQPKLNIRACTLVVVPSRGVADQWAEEIRTKTSYGSLPYLIYQEETACLIDQPCFRVVITTYDRLRAEFRNRALSNAAAPLVDTEWYRVVLAIRTDQNLDESHKIRTFKAMVTDSVLELRTKFRWSLTGTPLQNNISELFPIFAFLNINIPSKFKQDINYISETLKNHMVRRTKNSLQSSLTILPRREHRVILEFSEPERALYDYLERVLYQQVSQWRKQEHPDHMRAAASLLYLRLKQDLIPMLQEGANDRIVNAINNAEDTRERGTEGNEESELYEVCDIIESFYDQFDSPEEGPNIEALQQLPFIKHSTKLIWLINFLKNTLRASMTDKIIVVTQFVDLLLVISDVLASINIKHNCYHGDMTSNGRMISLRQFNHHSDVRVMLLSLKAGGVGLNLQRANHMVILDRWWNPDQAISRIHRMTQLKQTYIHTVVIKDTVEEGLMDNSDLFKTVVDREEITNESLAP
ncbi:hypothetical protein EC973_001318 [Apophysomyces ossiformis]|uniref:Uncharacterized protein n=1 Tax=Apophysomyces ossiformis TaxID=679940 RepID=A0A8H7BUC2_9FUNG|nr:hypothetical protein EC973_001318 [Apophysomyces ossiformis]